MADGVVVKINGDSKEFENELKGLDSIAKSGLTALAAGVAAVSSAMVYATEVGIEFEKSLAKINTIANTSSKSMDSIKNDLLNLSATTGIAATELSEAVYEAISSGVDTAKSVEFTATASKLAVGGFTSAASAVDILTTAINAYGLSVDDATKVSDILIQTQNLGKTTVDELASQMGRVIPTANAYGVKIDQLGASYALLTANGIATNETTTYLNSMLNELGKSGTTASDALKRSSVASQLQGKTFDELVASGINAETLVFAFGKKIKEFNGDLEKMNLTTEEYISGLDILTETGEVTSSSFADMMDSGKNLGEVVQLLSEEAKRTGLSLGDMFGSVEAGKAAMVIAKGGVEEFTGILNEMQNSTGLTETAFKTMQETTETALEKMKNNLKNAAISFFDKFKKPLKDGLIDASKAFGNLQKSISSGALGNSIDKLGKKIGGLISEFAKFAEKALPKVIDGLAWLIDNLPKIMKNITPIVAGIVAYNAAVKIAAAVQGIWNAAMMSNPIGLVIGAIATLTAGIISLSNTEAAETEAQKLKREAIEENINKSNELVEATKAIKEAYQDNINTINENLQTELTEIDNTKKLADELLSIVDANGQVKAGYEERAAYLLGEYNKAMGTEFQLIDNQILKYGELKDSVYTLIEAQKAKVIQDSVGQALTESIAKETEMREAGIEAAKLYADTQAELEPQIRNIADLVNDLTGKTMSYQEALTYVTEGADAFKESNTELYNALKQSEKYSIFPSEEEINSIKKLYDSMLGYKETFEEYSKLKQKTAELEEQYSTNAKNIAEGNYEAVSYAALKSAQKTVEIAGLKGPELVAKYMEINDKIEQYTKNKNFALTEGEKAVWQEMIDNAEYERRQYAEAYYDSGYNAIVGLRDGITNKEILKQIEAAGQNAAEGFLDKYKTTLDINSPSKKTIKAGEDTSAGIPIGIKNNTKNIIKAAQDQVKSILSAYKFSDSSLAMVRNAELRASTYLNSFAPAYATLGMRGFSVGTVQNTYNNYTTERSATVIENVLTLDGEKIYQNQKKIAENKGINISNGGW